MLLTYSVSPLWFRPSRRQVCRWTLKLRPSDRSVYLRVSLGSRPASEPPPSPSGLTHPWSGSWPSRALPRRRGRRPTPKRKKNKVHQKRLWESLVDTETQVEWDSGSGSNQGWNRTEHKSLESVYATHAWLTVLFQADRRESYRWIPRTRGVLSLSFKNFCSL